MVDKRLYKLIDDLLTLNEKIVALEIFNLAGKRLYRFSKKESDEQASIDVYQDLSNITKTSKTLAFENIKITVIDKELSKIAIVNISTDSFVIIAFCQEASLTDIVDVVSYLSNGIYGMNKQTY